MIGGWTCVVNDETRGEPREAACHMRVNKEMTMVKGYMRYRLVEGKWRARRLTVDARYTHQCEGQCLREYSESLQYQLFFLLKRE
jgi:hypothetical protein